jgi:TRAP-type C4-dicarboxylate transport system substrate-binding protein
MKRLASFAVAGLLAAGSALAQQPIELRFASPAPPQSPINTRGLDGWIKEVTAASGGTISVRLMPGPTLATFENVYDRVLKGVADIGFGTSGTVGGQFRKTEVATLPFETENVTETSVALWRTMQRGLIADEYSEVKPLALFSFPHNLIHTRSTKLKSMSDLKGLKIGTAGKLNADMVALLGGAPISVTPADLYQSLSNGLVDGTIMAWTAVESFKLYEVAKNHLMVSVSSAPAYVVMNKRSYERLPPQAKAAIDRYSGEAFSRRMAGVVQGLDDFAKEKIKAAPGQSFDGISADEQARLRRQLDGISTEWVKGTPNGAAILAGFREEVKKLRSGP